MSESKEPTLTEQQIETLIQDVPDVPPIVRNEKGQFAKGSHGQHAMQNWSYNSWRRSMFEAFKNCITKEDFEEVCKVLLKKAKKGDRYAIEEILNRCLGKESISLSVTSEDIKWEFKFDLSKKDIQDQDIQVKEIDCKVINESDSTINES